MTISRETERRILEKKRTFDQSILSENIYIKDFPLDPWTPFLKTNNFVQQGINRLLAFDLAEKKWVRIRADSEGKLIVAPLGIGSSEEKVSYEGLATDVDSNEEIIWGSTQKLSGVDLPYTVPEGYKLYVLGLFCSGNVPTETHVQLLAGGTWTTVSVKFCDSYSHYLLDLKDLGSFASGTSVRFVTYNRGGSGAKIDFSFNAYKQEL